MSSATDIGIKYGCEACAGSLEGVHKLAVKFFCGSTVRLLEMPSSVQVDSLDVKAVKRWEVHTRRGKTELVVRLVQGRYRLEWPIHHVVKLKGGEA
jgi:hypothetical protein